MITKRYLSKQCRVTFYLPQPLAAQVERVLLVGDFNHWAESGDLTRPMVKSGGTYKLTLTLGLDREYMFKYHLFRVGGPPEGEWHNDWHADKYAPGPYGGDNSVVFTYRPAEEPRL